MHIFLLFETKHILNSGELINTTFTYHLDKELMTNSLNTIKFKLREIKLTNDIRGDTFEFFGLTNRFTSEYALEPELQRDSFSYEQSAFNAVSFSYSLDNVLIQTEVSPDSIVYACFKIGGLLGLARVFFLLSMVHEYQFEQDLKKYHKETKT